MHCRAPTTRDAVWLPHSCWCSAQDCSARRRRSPAIQRSASTGSNFEIDTDANLKRRRRRQSLDWANVDRDAEAGRRQRHERRLVRQRLQGGHRRSVRRSTDSIPPNKSDLKTFGLYKEVTAGTKSYLNLFWTRVQDTSGTTNMDFEFNQRQARRRSR